MIGSVLNNRYEIGSELGQGGMGIVYRAHDNLLKRDVAVKLIEKGSLGTEGRARLLHEARSAAALNHTNVVSIYDAGEADKSPYIVMELVPGHSLYTHRPENIEEIIDITKQILAALEHAHAHGVIHRDLKPENVIISNDGTAKLTDFGLARSVASRLSSEGMIVGTVFYLAPELARGQEYDGRADLYALGVMLYELTTGKLPFTSDDPLAVISQHLNAPVIPPRTKNPDLPLAIETLILNLLAKEPADRPGSASKVLEALDRLESDTIDAEVSADLSVLDRIVRGRLVGRQRELTEAIALWRTAVSGSGQVLLVSGEPGVGKTRFVRELGTRIEISGGKVLLGECYAEGTTPYAPITQMIHSFIDELQDLDLSQRVLQDLATLAPELRPHLSQVLSPAAPETESQDQKIYESIVSLFQKKAARTPILIYLDDGHWADRGTLGLLRHLARRMRAHPIMIVITYREIELDETRPFLSILHDLNRERLATRLKLARLDRQGTRELLASLLAEEITTGFLEGIYLETEGNPFFVEEVIKSLVEKGDLYYEGDRWHRPRMAEMEIPQSVHLAVRARVGKLPEAAQETLQQAAIFGREFDYQALKTMTNLNEDVLIEALESAERAQLIQEIRRKANGRKTASLAFSFVHALIPSSLYENLSRLRRPRLHRQAAEALEQVFASELETIAPRLGRHFAEAGESENAIKYLLMAGDNARDLYAYHDAIEAYQQALTLMRDLNDLQGAARTLMKLGLLFHTIYDYAQSRQAYQDGFAMWQQAGETQPAALLPPAPHPFRVTWEFPPTLDPGLAIDNASATAIEQLFYGLVEHNTDMEIVPAIASSWEIQDGGRKYTFRLRDDVVWSDGTPVTAHDFEYAWKRVLNPATGSRAAEWLYDLRGARAYHQGATATSDEVGVHAINETTLLVELDEPAGYFLHLMSIITSFPVPRGAIEAFGDSWTAPENIITNGPFRIKNREGNNKWILARNPDFVGRFTGNLEEVELKMVVGISPETLKWYQADELDMIGIDYQADEFDQARWRHTGEYVTGPGLFTTSIALDKTAPPFDDEKVREAFVRSVDREYLANILHRGYADPAYGGFVPPGIPGHSEGIALEYDVEKARRLLVEAGYPDGKGFPPVQAIATQAASFSCEFVQAQWRQNLGVEVDWKILDWSQFLETIYQEAAPIIWLGWSADYPDPDGFLRVPFSRYRTLLWDDTYVNLLHAARRNTVQKQRIEYYQQADRYAVASAAIMPLTYGRWHLLVKPWVKKLPLSPFMGGIFMKDIVMVPH